MHMNRFIICCLYHAIGRAGEVGLITWSLMQCNHCLRAPEVMWNDRKNAKSNPCVFFNDAHTWHICWIHACFCYLMADGSHSFHLQSGLIPEGKRYLFPTLAYKKSQEISRYVTQVIHDAAKTGKVKGLNTKHTSHGLKHGAADDCCVNPLCNIVYTVCRAGWTYSGDVSLDEIVF